MNSTFFAKNVLRPAHRRQSIVLTIITVWMLLLKCAFASGPVLQGITPNPAGTEIYLHFSVPLCPGPTLTVGATHLANYSLLPSAPITAATLLADKQTVRLDFAPALASGNYTLQVATQPNFGIFDCVGFSNQLVSPVSVPFTVDGTLSGPFVFYTVPVSIGVDCNTMVTAHGGGFDAAATMELIPGSISGASPSVNTGGTTISATFPGGITPGTYSIVVKNPHLAAVFPDQSSPPYQIPVQAVTIASSWPYIASGCSSENVTVYGGGFCSGATLEAVPVGGGITLPGTAVTISPAGNQVSASINFGSAAPGPYNLVVHNPGGGSATSPLSIYVVGASAWTIYPDRVGNCGVQTFLINGTFCPGDAVQLVPNAGGTPIPGLVNSIVPAYAWGEIMSADFNLFAAPPGVYHIEVMRGAGPWVPSAFSINVLAVPPCSFDIQMLGRRTVGYTRVNTFTINVRNISCSPVGSSVVTLTVPSGASPTLSAPTAGGAPGGTISPGNVVTYSVPGLAAGAVYPLTFDMLLPNVGDIIDLTVNSDAGCTPLLHSVTVVTSQDPNSKTGLPGINPRHFIRGNETLPYEIHFENLPGATAPAQDVFITDRLNPAQFNLSTFSLGDISFGNQVITPPPNLTSYSYIVPYDLDGNPATTADQLLLVVDARLITNPADPDYGRITWSYRSLDPLTMDTPANPLLGFLPPNTASPVGEGSVKYSVKLLPPFIFGSQLGSAAVVIFDQNAPIYTNPWFNEISPPVLLRIAQNSGQIEITWVGAPGDWFLEQTPQLDPTAWTPVGTAPVSISGGRQLVSLPPLGQQSFFRLRR